MEEKSYKEYLEHITTFIFDVDGVLTDGTITITTSGEMLPKMALLLKQRLMLGLKFV